ncbi:DUF6173 family protein [Seohaeicola zhoushanensis]|uniref:Uncharacterized protein n=1 Tax=Seohaeicola zhoushanensis TaxID=1569283 RepID=A0A8J3GU39_9RHOB|nr:DUF6173 family protein [Seohaeicola zhoushanensis]GHF37678.1 hypothetical protein GCM10017056_07020 [Seohaeicola zhoushanensis]
MTETQDIATTAEAEEAAILPRLYEVHTEDAACEGLDCVPDVLNHPVTGKSAAQWAYERLILYIQNFEKQLDGEHEVAMGFTGSEAGVLRIEGMGYFDPDILTFYGTDLDGSKTQMVQHVSQLNVMLRAVSKPRKEDHARRIGFRLAEHLEEGGDASPQAE